MPCSYDAYGHLVYQISGPSPGVSLLRNIQLLRLHSQGMPLKRIARTLGISRNTVKGYLRKVSEGTKRMEDLLALDNPVLEAHFHAGNPYPPDQVHIF